MARARKSKQTTSTTVPLVSRTRAPVVPPIPDGLINPHRKRTKAWTAWEEAHPLPPTSADAPIQPPTNPPARTEASPSVNQDLQNIAIRLKAIDDYTTDKWEGLNGMLDEKIEVLATAIGNRIQSVLGGNQVGTQSTSIQSAMSAMPTTSVKCNILNNLTSQWKWVEQSVLTSIIDLKFDPVNLHKLSPPEDVTHFNLSLETTAIGSFLVKLDGSVTAVNDVTKLDKSLPSFEHWLSAFSVYASVRAVFDPTGEICSALFMFIREMNHYQLNFEWKQVLRYFLETFREYQDKPASAWKVPYYPAYAKHMHHNVASSSSFNRITKSPHGKSTAPAGSHKEGAKRLSPEERAQQICQLYNLADKKCKEPCPGGRRHVCLSPGCGKPHPLYEHR